MDHKTDTSDRPRTLVVILGTHRCGSSLTTRILHRLGMSLGPFELIGPLESNRHGHFEPVPINHFDMQLQKRIFGFDGDMPHTEEALSNLLQSDGRWNSNTRVSESDLEFGLLVVRQLVESGNVSGFKDPRVILLWPYWREVLRGLPELRIVLLTVLRSPHEVAMSIFMRGKGRYTYHDALDVTAANLRRMQEISKTWDGEQALVRFDPRVYTEDLRKAAEFCGLLWRDDIFKETYDPSDRHHDPTRVEHDAQRLFDETSGLPQTPADHNALSFSRDSALREKLIQRHLDEVQLHQMQVESELDRQNEMVFSFSKQLQAVTDDSQRQFAESCAVSNDFQQSITRLTNEHSRLAQSIGVEISTLYHDYREDKLQQQTAQNQLSRDLVTVGKGITNLANLVNSECARLQAQHDDIRAASESMNKRLQVIEKRHFAQAAQCIHRIYHRFWRQGILRRVS